MPIARDLQRHPYYNKPMFYMIILLKKIEIEVWRFSLGNLGEKNYKLDEVLMT